MDNGKPIGLDATAQVRSCIEMFLVKEARLLDDRRFREWMDLFTEDGVYWVPAVSGQASPHDQASLFFDDRQLMKTRVDRLEHPLIHVQMPASRTVHIVGNLIVEQHDAAANEYTVSSSMIMAEYRLDQQRIFAGRQYHRLRGALDDLRIAHKRVDLVNCDSAFEAIAVPI
jgi:benzoate/toluate 1,2-dioxygenase beta subunit